MPNILPFEKHTDRYNAWFDKHPTVYKAELMAVKEMIPAGKSGLEIGTGTGRFAFPLGIRHGVEPSGRMREIAQKRGIKTFDGRYAAKKTGGFKCLYMNIVAKTAAPYRNTL